MPKVLIADKMDRCAEEIFTRKGISFDIKTGLSSEQIADIITDYDAVACRSSAKITKDVLQKAKNLKVIGRAGIGVDTIDVPAATAAGVIVMNTPFGNSITTAEHAIAMMMSLARQIPQASASTHAGKWEKAKFMGVELYGKILGLIGAGNIGSIVANRAIGLGMKVIAYDPFLTKDRAIEIGVEQVELDDLYKRADFISLHVPKTEKTSGMIDASALTKMKKMVRIINCARGGLIVEDDLKEALDSGHVAGAALDVFDIEPAESNVLFGHPNVICTPHLGASTSEAQVNVAIQVAEQISDYLLTGAIINAVNMPSISAEDAPKLKPYMALASAIGGLIGQIADSPIKKIDIDYIGGVSLLNTRPLTACILADMLRDISDSVNMVNAPEIMKSKGVNVSERRSDDTAIWPTAITITVVCEKGTHSITGTLFGGTAPRIVSIDGVPIEVALTRHMLLIRNEDRPGLIGAVGTTLANANINIADFRLGRIAEGKTAIALVSLDTKIDDDVMQRLASIPQIRDIRRLTF